MHPDMNSIKRSDWIEQLQVYNCGLLKDISLQRGWGTSSECEKKRRKPLQLGWRALSNRFYTVYSGVFFPQDG